MDLDDAHLLGLHLVGTVELPVEPAGARIFAVRLPAAKGGAPRYFIKAVVRHDECHTVTQFVPLDHVRLMKFKAVPATDADKAVPAANLSAAELKTLVEKISWDKHVKDDRATHEVELRPGQKATIVVPENASVMVRNEATVPAAVSREAAMHPMGLTCPKGWCPHGTN
jgi:hypothetical protein